MQVTLEQLWLSETQAILAQIEPLNVGSIGVVKKCGFSREGARTADDGVVVEQWVLARR